MRTENKVKVGDVAPDFTLPDQTGTPVRLSDLLGQKTVVLYFYPKDQTPGCTVEARAFRDSYDAFTAAGAEVVGVSADTVASHRRFVASHGLPFVLLSDRGGKVRDLYGVERTLGIVPGRVTYVIDRGGVVRHIYSSQLRATQHPREALTQVQAIAASPPVTS
ncbi:MAG TPA: peroxiredoxin, partial [Candidatus Dormibacteraeota bacterium]|nr:peroxiredoxin [Candidatus Dormibacteraeota bacterium]